MLRSLLLCAALLVTAAAAPLDGPADLEAGMAALAQGQSAKAIRLYTRAIESGQLSHDDLARAHVNRAVAQGRQRHFDDSIADYDIALKLRPDDPEAYYYRAHTYFALARFADASRDFARALTYDRQQRYMVIWLHLARAEAGEDDAAELAANAEGLDLDSWPGPVIALFLGRGSQKALTEMPGLKDEQARICEGAFYMGVELRFIHEDKLARRSLRTAHRACLPVWVEHEGAAVLLAQYGK